MSDCLRILQVSNTVGDLPMSLLQALGFRLGLRFHDGLDFVEVPRLEVVAVYPDVHRERQRIVRQVSVRMAVELPSSA